MTRLLCWLNTKLSITYLNPCQIFVLLSLVLLSTMALLPSKGTDAPMTESGEKRSRTSNQEKSKKETPLDKETKKLMTVLMKQVLHNTQQIREVEGALFDTMLGPSDSPLVLGMGEQGTNYQSAVKEAGKGHGLGPPHIYVFAGLISSLTKSNPAEVGEENHSQLVQSLKHLDTIDLHAKCELVQLCRLNNTHIKEIKRITLCFAPNTLAQQLRTVVVQSMMRLKWEVKEGKAPPSFMERELQEWLKVVLK